MATIYKEKERRSIKKFRKEMGLKEYVKANRICLKCKAIFKSEFEDNRVCKKCIKTVTHDSSGIDVHSVHGRGIDRFNRG